MVFSRGLFCLSGPIGVRITVDQFVERFLGLRENLTLEDHGLGMGRELFAGMRRNALTAEEGAGSWL